MGHFFSDWQHVAMTVTVAAVLVSALVAGFTALKNGAGLSGFALAFLNDLLPVLRGLAGLLKPKVPPATVLLLSALLSSAAVAQDASPTTVPQPVMGFCTHYGMCVAPSLAFITTAYDFKAHQVVSAAMPTMGVGLEWNRGRPDSFGVDFHFWMDVRTQVVSGFVLGKILNGYVRFGCGYQYNGDWRPLCTIAPGVNFP